MKRFMPGLLFGLAVAAAGVLSACGGGGDDGVLDRVGLSRPAVRLIHAIPNGPNLDFQRNGTAFGFNNEPYKFVSKYFDNEDTSTLFTFNVAGTSTEVGRAVVDAHTGHKYTVVALPGSGKADSLVIDDPFGKNILSDKARVRGLNASFNAQNVDMYITVPAADLNAATPTFAKVAYKSAVPASGQDSINLEGGTYRLRITTAGTKTVIFDSGALTLGNNADWLITTIPVDGISAVVPNKIKVLVAKANDDQQTALELVTQ